MLLLQHRGWQTQVYGGLHDTHSHTSNSSALFSHRRRLIASLMSSRNPQRLRLPHQRRLAGSGRPATSMRPDRHHRHPPDRPHGHQLGLADRRHQLGRADEPADREPARHGQEHRPVLLRRPERDFGRLELRSRAVAARPARRRSAGADQRQALQPLGAGPGLYRRRHRRCRSARRAPTSPRSPRSPSRTSRFCATARPRNMARTRSPAS